MSAELAGFWPVVILLVMNFGLGITVLATIGVVSRSLRRELGERIDGLSERITAVQREMNERFAEVHERIAGVQLEMSERFGELNERITAVQAELNDRIDAVRVELNERITAVRVELNERIAAVQLDLGERLVRIEGLVDGIGFVLRKRAGKERSGGEDRPAPPPS